jgi:hypothetical protein
MQALKTQALTQAYCPTAEIWKQDMLSNKTWFQSRTLC